MQPRRNCRWIGAAVLLTVGALLALAGCGTSGPPTPRLIRPAPGSTPSVLPPLEDVPAVARVNDVEIPSVVYGQELLRNAKLMALQQGIDWYSAEGQARLPSLQESVLDQLINQELLRQLAEAEGVQP
ncbi:MAG: SurA N-terminal domain-containing protein, partial [Anaerolineae bacterium]|nr:SurA N-terminal domain-containing protein [Anaerolineae bacterium]